MNTTRPRLAKLQSSAICGPTTRNVRRVGFIVRRVEVSLRRNVTSLCVHMTRPCVTSPVYFRRVASDPIGGCGIAGVINLMCRIVKNGGQITRRIQRSKCAPPQESAFSFRAVCCFGRFLLRA